MSTKTFLLSNALLFAALAVSAQPGSLDGSLNLGTAINGFVSAVAVQPDGKLLVGGEFSTIAGGARGRVARLTAAGALDASFNPGAGFPASVGVMRAFAVQADGKILVGGGFTSFNGTTRNRLVRLNPDGSFDTGFNLGTGFNGEVYTVGVQADGKIMVGGSFGSYRGVRWINLIRLNADGTPDAAFHNSVNGLNGGVYSVVQQADGKYMVGGAFSFYNTGTVPRPGLARLNADGTLDTGFVPAGAGFAGVVEQIVVQPDGKTVAVGAFSSFNGAPSARIARIGTSGALDATFAVGTGFGGSPTRLRLLPNGQLLVAGSFSTYNAVRRYDVALLNANGTLDTGFGTITTAADFNNTVIDIALQADGKIVCGGTQTTCGITRVRYLARLNGNTATATRPNAAPVWSLYPSAAPGQWLVTTGQPLTSLSATDALGRAVALPAVSELATPAVLDLSRHPAGVYFVRAGWGTTYRSGRVVKE